MELPIATKSPILRGLGRWRPTSTNVLVSRWIELILFDDHRVMRIALLLIVVSGEQLVRGLHHWALAAVVLLLDDEVGASVLSAILRRNLAGDAVRGAHDDPILLVLNGPGRSSSLLRSYKGWI